MFAYPGRYEWNRMQVQILSGASNGIGSDWGYRLSPTNTSNFSSFEFSVSLHSLSPDTAAPPVDAALSLTVGTAVLPMVRRSVAPMGVANAAWSLDLAAHADGPAAVVELSVSAERQGKRLAMPLKVRFHLGEWGCLAADSAGVPKSSLCT